MMNLGLGRKLLIGLSLGLLAACSNGTAVQFEDLVETAPEPKTDVPRAEDLLVFDVEVRAYEYVPEEGEFLWPCTANEDCDSGFCVVTKDGGRCTTQCMEDCPAGWACVEADTKPDIIYICVPRYLTLCDPCATNDDCKVPGANTAFLDLCLPYADGAGKFCGADCSAEGSVCPKNYTCKSVTMPGGTFQQCLPDSGECVCSFFAVQKEKSTECAIKNEFGTCTGKRSCMADGLTACSAESPADEKCDNQDNDCDDFLDEGCDDDGDGYCDSIMTTIGNPVVCGSGPGDCNDGDTTVYPGASELCDKKDNDCDGTIDDGLCGDGNACTDDLCDPIEGCSHPFNAAVCDDLNACTVNDHCFEGSCQGSLKNCDDNNPCTTDGCNPVSEQGCFFVNNQDPCADDGNPCTTDVCESGVCMHKLATDIPCDDGNPCTDGDKCKSGTCYAGGPKNCDDDEQCTKDSCDTAQGCVHQVLQGTPCVYSILVCDIPGTCGSNGCVPQPNCQCPNCKICVCCGIVQLCLDNIFG